MASSYTSFGRTRISDEIGEEYASVPNKWVLATFLGVFGGGLAYTLYKKKWRNGASPPRANNNLRQQPARTEETEFACIRDLPPEIRTRIWQSVSYDDLLNLRLTSEFTKADVETIVGLNGKITSSDPTKFDFFQKIALQSCKITELEEPIDHDFFLNPNVLQNLEIREHTPIPLDNIRSILGVSYNLKSLKLRLTLNDSTTEVSSLILEYLPSMKGLTSLHIKTKPRYSPLTKSYSSNALAFTTPKLIKNLHLEMPDLPEGELSKWKMVLKNQTSLENLTCNLGNVCWRYYEQVLKQNSATIERLVLEGLRGWNLGTNIEDPLDWSVFANFISLKSLDLSTNRDGEHDILNSINFTGFPCVNIEEFFVSRVMMSPEAVEKVYTEMVNLQRGALDHIGTDGIARANEMAWMVHQADETLAAGWWESERNWDLIFHGVFGITIALILAVTAKSASSSPLNFFGNEFTYDKRNDQASEQN
ncbi:hypothetical protein Ocin01_00906 [Orchesella cincta]|uniref:F-box domain-containing protein n=1 Tax=Orchesella cincta TaxID=48709 RepID=A0A1D2NKN0_ORCCI|nr:hypothetical protein Ocin01_00906 [Orchesella cincta]